MYKSIHFDHPTSSGAQLLDYLWLYTTHIIIAQYRAKIAALDKQLLLQNAQSPRRNRSATPGSRELVTGPVEIRKVLNSFRGFLRSEQSFYRTVITSIVEVFGLVSLPDYEESPFGGSARRSKSQGSQSVPVDLQSCLQAVGIPTSYSEGDELDNPSGWSVPHVPKVKLTHHESLQKIDLVHKALVCLGDIERYKEQYGSERDKKLAQGSKQGRHADGGRAGSKAKGSIITNQPTDTDEVYAKAIFVYEVARALVPENGNPSNQMAVVAMYTKDNFLAVYHYCRALACRKPFQAAEGNLNKLLKDSLAAWRAEQQANPDTVSTDSSSQGFRNLDAQRPLVSLKAEEVVLQAILVLGDREAPFEPLVASHLSHLGRLLAERAVPAEVIVKTLVLAITCHWSLRMKAVTDKSPERQDGLDQEGAALWYLFNVAGVMLDVADQEVRDGLGEERVADLKRSAQDPANDHQRDLTDGDQDLSQTSYTHFYPYITAVLRRLLPALRIFLKWLKANASLLNNQMIAQQEEFWTTYAAFLRHLEALFPLKQLPELQGLLEEDFDMRGFVPLKRAMGFMTSGGDGGEAKFPTDSQPVDSGDMDSAAHPNEEQLMRIADLICDGRLVSKFVVSGKSDSLEPRRGSRLTSTSYLQPKPKDTSLPLAKNVTKGNASGRLESSVLSHMLNLPVPDQSHTSESDVGDGASISTATEDDPVNLAMRATMGDGLSLVDDDERRTIPDENDDDEEEEEEDEEEEEVVWRSSRSQPTRDTFTSINPPAEPVGLATPTAPIQRAFTSPFIEGAPPQNAQTTAVGTRAEDLLHSLSIGASHPGPPITSPPTTTPRPGASPFSHSHTPLLFGGLGSPAGSSSIWSTGFNEPAQPSPSGANALFAHGPPGSSPMGHQVWSHGPSVHVNPRASPLAAAGAGHVPSPAERRYPLAHGVSSDSMNHIIHHQPHFG